jgi:hypothetical protein
MSYRPPTPEETLADLYDDSKVKWTRIQLTLSGHKRRNLSLKAEENMVSVDPTPEQLEAVRKLMKLLWDEG